MVNGVLQLCMYEADNDRVVIVPDSTLAVSSFRAMVDVLF